MQRINRIVGIGMNFFIPKEKLGLLKKYAGDKRYPEAAQYAKDIIDRINGNGCLPQDAGLTEEDGCFYFENEDIDNEPY
jgi:hypothetical protein